MADINKIKLPSGSEYNLKDYRIPGVDTTPTSGSDNIVTSGGIYTALNNLNDRIDSVQSDLNDIDLPGTLNTTATTAQITSSSESLSGTINLHKIAKTGSYNDLLNKPPEGPLVVEVNYNSQDQYDEMIGTIVSGTVAEIYEAYSNSRPVILRANVILDQYTTDTYYAQLTYSDSVYVENDQLVAGGFCFPVRSKTSSDVLFYFVWNVNDEAQNPLTDPGISSLIPVNIASFYAKYTKTTYTGIDYEYKYVLCDGLTDPNMSARYVLPTPNVTIPSNAKVIATTDQIPNAVTESTVSGWGFTKNTGTYSKPSTGIPATDLADDVITVHLNSDGTLSSDVAGVLGVSKIDGNDGLVYALSSSNSDGNEDYILATTNQIPTESTVSNWGFTKNTGTYSKPSGGIPASDLASAVQTSLGKADTALQSYTESDPVFSASAAAGITASDISNWNSKTSNTGTVTGVSFNGTAATVTNGVAAITAPQILSGTSDPVSSLGNNGDIYIKLSS